MRGLDDYLSRGHERQDDPPELEPEEQAFLDSVDESIERELSQAEAMSAVMDEVLRRIQRAEDEARGEWLQGRGR